MAKSLSIFGVLINASEGTDKKTVMEALSNNVDGFLLYKEKCRHREPCIPNSKGVIKYTVSVDQLASALWDIYSTAILQNRTNNIDQQPSLLVKINDADNNNLKFTVNESYKNKKLFIQEFTQKFEILRKSKNIDNRVLEEMESKKQWSRAGSIQDG